MELQKVVKTKLGKILIAGTLGTGGVVTHDQFGERKYIGWDENLIVQERVESNKYQYNSMSFQKPNLQYEEVVYFYPENYDPGLMQQLIDVAVKVLQSINPAGCSDTTEPPKQEPAPSPIPPPPGKTPPPPPPPTTGDEVDWYYNHIHFAEANKVTKAEGKIIGVVDTGVDVNHPDLKGRIVYYNNRTSESTVDQVGHGTWIAGAILAADGNGGMKGMTQAKLAACKALGLQGGDQQALGYCLFDVANAGAKWINNSWGGRGRSQYVEQVMLQLAKAGIHMHFATGNDGSTVSNPANFVPQVNAQFPGTAFAVCATDSRDQMATFSNRGPEMTNCAPGVRMKSTCPTNPSQMGQNYCYADGTSMATPVSVAVDVLANSVGKTLKTVGPLRIVDAWESVK